MARPLYTAQAISFDQACTFIATHHRHHIAPRGWKFGTSLVNGEGCTVGVVMVGRPVSRRQDDGFTLEVIRLCTVENAPNAASQLYGIARRVAKELGYTRIITYILLDEEGITLKAAGWKLVRESRGAVGSNPAGDVPTKRPQVRKSCGKPYLERIHHELPNH